MEEGCSDRCRRSDSRTDEGIGIVGAAQRVGQVVSNIGCRCTINRNSSSAFHILSGLAVLALHTLLTADSARRHLAHAVSS